MSALNPRVQFTVPDFLRTLELIRLGERQSEAVLEHPKMMAATVHYLIAGGDTTKLDVGDLAIDALARATIALCDDPLNEDAIVAFKKARDAWREIDAQ